MRDLPARRRGLACGTALTALLALASALPANAAECPGNPTALGTSRTLVVDPTEHPRIGTMQYPETLPLADHEVVLTFDDGPLPKHTKPVLDMLAAECVKATFFIIGRMARDYPAALREVQQAGHTIGTHTQNHPLGMNRMPFDQAKTEIDDGIASTVAALGDATQVAPFVRIPGLRTSAAIEDYLASKHLMAWSADFPADDWHKISAAQVARIALSRLEAKGRGILLLHDIQARTEGALPVILKELKARGYRIVHVVPVAPGRPKTPTAPWQWRLHPSDPTIAHKPESARPILEAALAAKKPRPRSMLAVRSRQQHAVSAPALRMLHGNDATTRLLYPAPLAFKFADHRPHRSRVAKLHAKTGG
ncbi:MAG: polysaccharide deacetylase family protein [Afipia sp.]|nr:polysaccharide deacetylase family protein [Afipia sp.]OJW61966.1 MAG: polysaccharide deacetylase [Afipia sp. 64-13]